MTALKAELMMATTSGSNALAICASEPLPPNIVDSRR
jgi:hypothetical protein